MGLYIQFFIHRLRNLMQHLILCLVNLGVKQDLWDLLLNSLNCWYYLDPFQQMHNNLLVFVCSNCRRLKKLEIIQINVGHNLKDVKLRHPIETASQTTQKCTDPLSRLASYYVKGRSITCHSFRVLISVDIAESPIWEFTCQCVWSQITCICENIVSRFFLSCLLFFLVLNYTLMELHQT